MKDYKNKSVSLYKEPRDFENLGYYVPYGKNNNFFYFFILLVFLGSSLFVYMKIKEKNNVFYEIYTMISPEVLKQDLATETKDESIGEEVKVDDTKESRVDQDLLTEIIEMNRLNNSKDKITSASKREDNGAVQASEVGLEIKSNLFLVKVNKDDIRKISLIFLEKEIKTTQSDYFFDLINTLIGVKGLDASEINTFDEKVILNRATLENNVLVLDFNDGFEYSRYGIVGIRSRIQQILWTVFSNSKDMDIEAVSFVINGSRKESIGDGYSFKLFYTSKDLEKKLDVSNV